MRPMIPCAINSEQLRMRLKALELTVTVTFEDGRTSTQTIDLHAGNFLADWGDGNKEDSGLWRYSPRFSKMAQKCPIALCVANRVRRGGVIDQRGLPLCE